MERTPIFQLGKEIARFFVCFCEGEKYVPLMEQFRQARSREELIEVIHSFIYYGETRKVQAKQLHVTPAKWQTLCRFIRQGKIKDVRQLHVAMMSCVASLEIERIRQTEQYLTKLLEEYQP